MRHLAASFGGRTSMLVSTRREFAEAWIHVAQEGDHAGEILTGGCVVKPGTGGAPAPSDVERYGPIDVKRAPFIEIEAVDFLDAKSGATHVGHGIYIE